jgi:hypothetical protein
MQNRIQQDRDSDAMERRRNVGRLDVKPLK